jgi:hypothetical protein
MFFSYFFSANYHGPLIWYLIAIFLFVAGFSRIARGEVAPASGSTNYCYHCGQGIDTGKSDRCTECGRTLEQDKLARSTHPPLSRTIEWFSLAATFAPLIVLTIFFVLFRAWPQASHAVDASGVYGITPGEHFRTVVYGLLLVLVGGWFVVAAVRYCRDRTNPGRSILMWLAGIPLVDGVLAYELDLPWLVTAICLGLFLVTIWGHRRIAGT